LVNGFGEARSETGRAKVEVPKGRERGGLLGEGAAARPSPPARGSEERCKLP